MEEKREELKKILDMALLGTQMNLPNRNIGEDIFLAITNYVNEIKTEKKIDNSYFVNIISEKSTLYGIELRNELLKSIKKNNDLDIVLFYLDILYNFCYERHNNQDLNLNLGEKKLLYNKYISNYYKLTKNRDKNFENEFYKNIEILEKKLLPYIPNVANIYINFLDKDNVFNFDFIGKNNMTSNARFILSNNQDFGLMDNIGGKFLSGNIKIESQRGYLNNPEKAQQDSIISIGKNELCFMNVIADGAGGSKNGEKASKEITMRLRKWFLSLHEDLLKDPSKHDFLKYLLNKELLLINNEILKKYPGSFSTVVIALTVYDKTIIANVGDSTAYAYDKLSNKLIELTTLDSPSRDMTYEEARHNPENNLILSGVGLLPLRENIPFLHFNTIKNEGQKIILSSDGVTDLISEERFKSYFKNDISAKQIVSKAVNEPDIDETIKKDSDNVSAITITLPNFELYYNKKKSI